MDSVEFALFETALGISAVAWTARGIVGVQLPEASVQAARLATQRRFPCACEAQPPSTIGRICAAIATLLRDGKADLGFVALDMSDVPEFDRRVYTEVRAIPPGATLSYGGVAKRLGEPRLTREVGQALARNPFPIVVPCHRVLAHGGRLGGFSARGGVATKLRLLAIEGADAAGARSLFDLAAPIQE